MALGALRKALSLYQGNPRASAWLEQHLRRLEEPLRVALLGRRESGKSTLLNALVGQEVAAAGTRTATWYTGSLPGLALIDTPGAESLTPQDPAWSSLMRTAAEADAILYVTDRLRPDEVKFLAALHSSPVAEVSVVNTVVVLSRADELGTGGVDAMITARQIARQHLREPAIASLCQDVVPVAGLLAQGAQTFSDSDVATLGELAILPQNELAALLLSADRLVADELTREARTALLHRFGLFGLRLATTLIRRGFDTTESLSAELVSRSGLGELRETVGRLFADRRDALKARAALLGLEALLRSDPQPNTQELFLDLHRILANAHEFRELRLLAALRTDRTGLPADLVDEAAQLTGGQGRSPAERLGGSSEGELLATAAGALEQWRYHAENPLAAGTARQAAQVVVRSCEELIAELGL